MIVNKHEKCVKLTSLFFFNNRLSEEENEYY